MVQLAMFSQFSKLDIFQFVSHLIYSFNSKKSVQAVVHKPVPVDPFPCRFCMSLLSNTLGEIHELK